MRTICGDQVLICDCERSAIATMPASASGCSRSIAIGAARLPACSTRRLCKNADCIVSYRLDSARIIHRNRAAITTTAARAGDNRAGQGAGVAAFATITTRGIGDNASTIGNS